MKHRDSYNPLLSVALVSLVIGIATIVIAMILNASILNTETRATDNSVGIEAGDAEVGSTEESSVSTVLQEVTSSGDRSLTPVTLQIPRIDVHAEVEHVGVTEDGRMDSPAEWENVAWFKYGYFPGAAGNAVIAGHLDSTTGPAIFSQLHQMEPGDEITVTGVDGEELTFVVTDVESVPADQAPLDRIFGESSTPQLNLITCEGHFDSSIEDYDRRLIVYSRLAES